MEQYIHCTKENAVAIVTINRPKALNALNPGVLREFYDTMDQPDNENFIKIITGAGEKAFALSLAAADQKAGMNAFLEKRHASFQ